MRPFAQGPALLAALLLAAPGLATAQTGVAATAARSQAFGAAEPLSADALRLVRAGQEPVANISAAVSSQVLTADTHDNRIEAGSVTSGAVTLSAGALQGFSGLGNFVINTGNNNTLQGSLSVSVFMTPTTP